ncbi:unnamed protein product, partial [Cyprideis torosa]
KSDKCLQKPPPPPPPEPIPDISISTTEDHEDEYQRILAYLLGDYTAYLKDDDGESEEKIVDKVDHSVLYNVYLMPSLITDICGECCLQVARHEIGLYDVEEKRLKLLHWPIECIMKYGVDSKKLVMQVNNNCLTGKGVFWFETTELKPVFGALYYTAEYWRRRNKRLWEKKKQRDMTFDKTPRRFPLRLHRPKMSIENVIEHAMEPPKSVQPPPRIRKISTEGSFSKRSRLLSGENANEEQEPIPFEPEVLLPTSRMQLL